MVFEIEMKKVDITGTELQGYVRITYKDLVSILGEPNAITDGYKTDAEWCGVIRPQRIWTGMKDNIQEEIFTVYNYKTGKNYLGDEGLDVEDITDWHIGATKNWVAFIAQRLIHDKLEELKRETNS